MKTSVAIETLSEDEVEEIAAQTFFLLQNNWKRVRVDRYTDDFLKDLDRYYFAYTLEGNRWVKDNASQTVSLKNRDNYGTSASFLTVYFSREEAYEYEINLNQNR